MQARDAASIVVGSSLCLSQMIIQFQSGTPSIPMLTTGAGLLTGALLLNLTGDGRNNDKRQHRDS